MAHYSPLPGQTSTKGGWMSQMYGARDAAGTAASLVGSSRTTPTHAPASPLTPGQYISDASSLSPPRGLAASASHPQQAFLPEAARTTQSAAPPSEPISSPGLTTSVSPLYQQQADWDRQMQFHDQKQAELLTEQWKLVREQTGAFARELGSMQEQLRELKGESRRMVVEVERLGQDREAKYAEELSSRQSLADVIEQQFQTAMHNLDAEAKLRVSEIQDLQSKVLATEEFRKLREECRNDVQACMAQYDEQWRNHMSALAVERSDRQKEYCALRDTVAALEKDVLPQLEMVQSLNNQMREVESSVGTKVKESHKASEQEIQRKMEGHAAEVSAMMEKERSALVARVGEYEHMFESLKTNVKEMLVEQTGHARHACDEVQSTLTGQIQRETTKREAQHSTLLDHYTAQKSAMDARADKLDAAMRAFEQGSRDELASMQARHVEAWTRTLREQGDFLQAKIKEESSIRDTQGAALEERMEFFGRFYKEIWQVFLQTGSPPMQFESCNSSPLRGP